MATVLIIGASRGIGLETVKAALAAGHTVRALARSADGIAIDHANLKKIAADACDPDSLEKALKGVDAVIQTLGVAPGPDMIVRPVRLFSTATRALVAAMKTTGVKRLICVTGFGAGDSRGKGSLLYNAFVFPLLLKRAYDDKDVQEMIIRRSGLDWVIVRPGLLTSGPRTKKYRALTDPWDWRLGSISRADVAHFLVAQVDDDTYLGKTPVLIR